MNHVAAAIALWINSAINFLTVAIVFSPGTGVTILISLARIKGSYDSMQGLSSGPCGPSPLRGSFPVGTWRIKGLSKTNLSNRSYLEANFRLQSIPSQGRQPVSQLDPMIGGLRRRDGAPPAASRPEVQPPLSPILNTQAEYQAEELSLSRRTQRAIVATVLC